MQQFRKFFQRIMWRTRQNEATYNVSNMYASVVKKPLVLVTIIDMAKLAYKTT